jgi:hypothetical protein
VTAHLVVNCLKNSNVYHNASRGVGVLLHITVVLLLQRSDDSSTAYRCRSYVVPGLRTEETETRK